MYEYTKYKKVGRFFPPERFHVCWDKINKNFHPNPIDKFFFIFANMMDKLYLLIYTTIIMKLNIFHVDSINLFSPYPSEILGGLFIIIFEFYVFEAHLHHTTVAISSPNFIYLKIVFLKLLLLDLSFGSIKNSCNVSGNYC